MNFLRQMKFLKLCRAILREIFEESAYERFCAREGLARGRASYKIFVRGGRPRVGCC